VVKERSFGRPTDAGFRPVNLGTGHDGNMMWLDQPTGGTSKQFMRFLSPIRKK